jgi:uncharacterized membrane protein (DUF106 family)
MRQVSINEADLLARSAMMGISATAKSNMVNRTHRVVRERARTMQANRSRMRGLMLPLFLCSSIMILLFTAFWLVLEQYELVSSESTGAAPASSHHMFLLLLWFLPVSVALMGMVWFRRSRNQSDAEAIR